MPFEPDDFEAAQIRTAIDLWAARLGDHTARDRDATASGGAMVPDACGWRSVAAGSAIVTA